MADHQCVICSDFSTTDQELMRRHVAIVHGQSAFSSLQCEVCERKYYDFDHFKDHIRETPACSSEVLKITPVPLTQKLEDAFVSLVEQIMKPPQVQFAQFPLTEGQSLTTRGNTSSNQVPNMESNGDSGIPKIISVTSLADHQSNRKTRRSVGRHIRNVGLSSNRVSTATDIGTDGKQKQTRRKLSVGDLRLHCRQIILKRAASTIAGRLRRRTSLVNTISNGQCIKQSSVLPEHLRAQKEICTEKVKKYVKGGKLQCKLCHKWMTVSRNKNNSDTSSIHSAYCHAQSHVRDVVLFECSICDYGTSCVNGMYSHVKRHGSHQRKFIDHTTEHYSKILEMFMACFDMKAAGEGTQTTGAGNGNGETSSSTSDPTNYYSVCTKCGFKTTIEMVFLRHQKIMHGVHLSQAHEKS